MSGNLWQRGPGVWMVRIGGPRDPISGRRRQIRKTVHGSRRDAQQVLNGLAVEVDRGQYKGAATTLGQLLDQWLDLATADLSPTTVKGYRQKIN